MECINIYEGLKDDYMETNQWRRRQQTQAGEFEKWFAVKANKTGSSVIFIYIFLFFWAKGEEDRDGKETKWNIHSISLRMGGKRPNKKKQGLWPLNKHRLHGHS